MGKTRWLGIISVLVLFWFLMPGKTWAEDDDRDAIRSAIKMTNSGDYQGAIKIFTGLLQKGEEYVQKPELHFHLGIAYYNSGAYDRALAEFAATEKLNPNKSMVHYFSGLIYEAQALNETNASRAADLRNKALQNWEEFIRTAEPERADKVETAQKHISMIKEKINEK
jgi:tetratricopeptide (TPR) repeat protein